GYQHYTQNSFYNGTEQVMQLGYSRQATRRLSFSLREAAGTYDRGFYGGFDAIGYVDPTFANVPSQELFDHRVYYLNTLGDMTYHKSARMSFNFGGDGFLIRRRSTAFYGTTGYRARGDAVYRLSRRASTGVAYDFTHYEYTKAFGASDLHGVSLVESFQVGRRAELSLRFGAYRIETLGITRVTFEPAIAAILGVTSGAEVLYRVNYAPSLNAAITWGFRTSSLGLSYQRGVTAGNGVYLTSRTTSAGVSYSYSGIRRWAFNLNGGYDSLGSLTQDIGNYNAFRVSMGVSYDVGRGTHFVSNLDFRHYAIETTNYARDPFRVSAGLSFAPGEVPLRFW
ncbi:MAG: hypothetical protein ACRD8O_06485, partial [Bryobacteraceae bacterium]